MESSNLFRSEAMSAQVDLLEGDILLTRSWPSWIVFGLALFIIAVVFVFLCFTHYTKRTDTTGMLVPHGGAIMIVPPSPGIISIIHVEEGQYVHAGDSLFTLKDERHLSSLPNQSGVNDSRFADQIEAALRDEEQANLREKIQLNVLLEKTLPRYPDN